MKRSLLESIENEIATADRAEGMGDSANAFRHLERAHVLAQESTYHHTRAHWLMLKHGLRHRNGKEVAGQILRFVGAATKTPLGIYPKGNTGGANVSPFRSMPVEDDLKRVLQEAGK